MSTKLHDFELDEVIELQAKIAAVLEEAGMELEFPTVIGVVALAVSLMQAFGVPKDNAITNFTKLWDVFDKLPTLGEVEDDIKKAN